MACPRAVPSGIESDTDQETNLPKVISIHSYRGGTGKSNLTANLAASLAELGKRVAVVDTDIQSPGIHMLFGVEDTDGLKTLNDYLWERCPILEAATDVTPVSLTAGGRVWLVPSSLKAGEIARVLREGYDVGLLNDGFRDLMDDLALDYLLIDTHPGLNEETLLSIAVSDELVVLLRPDRQDFQGTAVTVEVARKLGVKELVIVLNKVLPAVADRGFQADVERTYNAPVIGVLPESPEMLELGSGGLFSLRFPDHPLSQEIRRVVAQLV
jgi:MinD-like ATPase involved in chromosome partitioning or flagellar assembly